jgi:hypothetical protein
MAAEQFVGAPADSKTDQFSFCVALYEGLYGERPFKADSVEALAVEVLSGRIRPRPPTASVPDLVGDALVRGLRTKREQRYPSMEVLLETLEALRANDPTKDSAAPSRPGVVKMGTWVVATLACLATVGLLWRGTGRSPEPPPQTTPIRAAALPEEGRTATNITQDPPASSGEAEPLLVPRPPSGMPERTERLPTRRGIAPSSIKGKLVVRTGAHRTTIKASTPRAAAPPTAADGIKPLFDAESDRPSKPPVR